MLCEFFTILSYTAVDQMDAHHDCDAQLDSLHFAQTESIHYDCERCEYSFLYMEPCAVCGCDGE